MNKMLKELKKLREMNYKNSIEKGFYRGDVSALSLHAMMHREISEATQCVMDNDTDIYNYYYEIDGKPEGEAVELVDVVIMIMNYFSHNNWDFEKILKKKMKYNECREYSAERFLKIDRLLK